MTDSLILSVTAESLCLFDPTTFCLYSAHLLLPYTTRLSGHLLSLLDTPIIPIPISLTCLVLLDIIKSDLRLSLIGTSLFFFLFLFLAA